MFMSIFLKFLFLHDIQLSIFSWYLIHWDSEKLYLCTLGVSLCLILWDDFLSDVHKFMRRTWNVRWLNLCVSGGKSATKAGAREIPRVHTCLKYMDSQIHIILIVPQQMLFVYGPFPIAAMALKFRSLILPFMFSISLNYSLFVKVSIYF